MPRVEKYHFENSFLKQYKNTKYCLNYGYKNNMKELLVFHQKDFLLKILEDYGEQREGSKS